MPEARANAKRIEEEKRGKAWLREAGLTDDNSIHVGAVNPSPETSSESSEYAKYMEALAARRANPGAGSQPSA